MVPLLVFAQVDDLIYRQDFEDIPHNSRLNRDFQVWENGAVVRLFLETRNVASGQKSMRLEVISPNPNNQSIDGSIYHTLSTTDGDWSDADAIRFWINNPNEEPLLITFNFKEKFREYWAVAETGTYFLQTDINTIHQQDIHFNNLPIPPQFNGFVIIPFISFEVPEWNTAVSDGIMNLDRIDSFALGVRVKQETPFTFYVDDIEVFSQPSFPTLTIEGPNWIQIPTSGELLETYSVLLGDIYAEEKTEITAHWKILPPSPQQLQISQNGILSIPAGIDTTSVILRATYEGERYQLVWDYPITLAGSDPGEVDDPQPDPPFTENEETASNRYDAFSARFDVWARDNRPLFVGLVIIIVLIFLILLSSVQRKLK